MPLHLPMAQPEAGGWPGMAGPTQLKHMPAYFQEAKGSRHCGFLQASL